ncbi:MAG: hypothetical protein AAF481_09620 [Acidobacteriota bacterium]
MSYRLKILTGFLVAAGTFAALHFWRGFRPEHALMVAIACGALAYASLRTVERLLNIYRRRGSSYSVDWDDSSD